ncbi:thiamine pyrophosphate-dependent enzyme [Nonomuraea ferruginea]
MPDALPAPARQPAARHRRPLAARAGRGLLHDRLGRSRGQRGRGRRAAPGRPRAAPLPVRRVLPDQVRAGRAAARTGHQGRPDGPDGGRRGADRGRQAQGVRPSRAGRHPPQTSTIASHLPRAVGVAFAIERARALDTAGLWPDDAIAVCSFGDASVNHATALSGFNTAAYATYQGQRVPILFVCEDNGIGISVRTPPEAGWRRPPGGPASSTSRPTAVTWLPRTTRRCGRWSTCAPTAPPRSCTCRRCG